MPETQVHIGNPDLRSFQSPARYAVFFSIFLAWALTIFFVTSGSKDPSWLANWGRWDAHLYKHLPNLSRSCQIDVAPLDPWDTKTIKSRIENITAEPVWIERCPIWPTEHEVIWGSV
jgi:hypothetical protein